MNPRASATAAGSDPVSVALSDPGVTAQLLTAARAFLGRGPSSAVRRTAEAEEIVSVAQIEALKRRADFDPTRDVVNWLVGFVRNVTRDHVRKRARTPTGPPPDAPKLEDLAVDLGCPVEDATADRELARRVLEPLSADDRELLELKYFDGLTFAEIAARRGMNENAVRLRHFRLRQRLREQYGHGGEVRS